MPAAPPRRIDTVVFALLSLLLFLYLPGHVHAESKAIVLANGQALAWGSNTWGELGDGSFVSRPYAAPVVDVNGLPVTGLVEIESGWGFHVARRADGTVYAWGYNGSGQLGGHTFANRPYAAPVLDVNGNPIIGIKDVLVTYYGCVFALTVDGKIYAWGAADFCALGNLEVVGENFDGRPYAGYVLDEQGHPLSRVIRIATSEDDGIGGHHGIALTDDGRAFEWGYSTAYAQPVLDSDSIPLDDVRDVHAAVSRSYFLMNDGGVLVRGDNFIDYKGDGTTEWNSFSLYPVPVVDAEGVPIQNVAKLEGAAGVVCALRASQKVYCWGGSWYSGSVGDGTAGARPYAVTVVDADGNPIEGIADISGSPSDLFLARTNDGELLAWGHWNSAGQLGDGTTIDRLYAVTVEAADGSALASVVTTNPAWDSSLAVTELGAVYTWGYNGDGQLGDGTTTNRSYAVEVVDASGNAIRGACIDDCSANANAKSLVFSPISDTSVNTPIPIQIEAVNSAGGRDMGVNGTVFLRTSPDTQISPTQLKMTDGLAIGDVELRAGGDPVTVSAQIKQLHGTSQPFHVDNPNLLLQPTLNVLVTMEGRNLFGSETATVRLRDMDGVVRESEAGFSNKANFFGIPAGRYQLWAELDQNLDVRSATQEITVSEKLFQTIEINMVDTVELPILIVPGMLGSTTESPSATFPRLPRSTAETNELKIFVGPLDWVGLKFLNFELTNAGFATYQVPWDWRVTLDEMSGAETAWQKYLLPKIDEAKDPDGDGVDNFDKVDIVAHSMGGLLARAYIQSSHYRNDINRFVMLGTPNEGAVNAYYLAHGGDVERADNTRLGIKKVYENTTRALMQDAGQNLDRWVLDESRRQILVPEPWYVKSFFDEYIPTGRQLLPTFPFLKDADSPVPRKLTVDTNVFLERLNSDETTLQRMQNGANPDAVAADKVKTVIFLSRDEDTDGVITVEQNFPNTPYTQGAPLDVALNLPGDGTVPVISGKNSSNACMQGGDPSACWMGVVTCDEGGHAKMFGSFADAVRNYLEDGIYACP